MESNQNLNILTKSGIVRSDVRTSLGTKNVAGGIPTTVEFTLININNNCAPLAGYALYMWHCTREGLYSMYSNGVTDEDYLRGVQATDANGKVSFQTVFPACYSGRWPHIHFEVYASLDKATGTANNLHTSQLAVPKDVCDTVYASAEGYSASVKNLSQGDVGKRQCVWRHRCFLTVGDRDGQHDQRLYLQADSRRGHLIRGVRVRVQTKGNAIAG